MTGPLGYATNRLLRRIPRTRAAVCAALTGALLAVTACGSSATDSGDGQGGSDGASDSAQSIKVTMELGTENLIMLPVLYAKAAGLFEKYGLDVSWQPTLVNSPALAQAVSGGKLDYAFADISGVVRGQASGLDVVSAGSMSKGAAYQIVLSNKAIDKIKSSGSDPGTMTVAQKFQAMKGLKIDASPGGVNEALLTTGLTSNGVNLSDVTIAPNSDQASVVVQLQNDQVQGFIFGPPTTQIPVTQSYGQIWIDFTKDLPGFSEMPISSVITSKAGAKSEATYRVFQAIKDAEGQLTTAPQTVASVVKKAFFPNLDQATFDSSFKQMTPIFLDHPFLPTEAGYQKMLSITTNPDGSHPTTPMNQVYDDTQSKRVD